MVHSATSTQYQYNHKALNPADVANNNLLINLQGNILKSHGRDNTFHIFLNFNNKNVQQVRQWIATLPITSAKEQLNDTELYKAIIAVAPEKRSKEQDDQLKELSDSIVSFFFISNTGYSALNVGTSWLADTSFINGMKSQLGLQDPPPAQWDFSTSNKNTDRIDAMLLIASDDFRNLLGYKNHLLASLPAGVTLVYSQPGHVLRSNKGIGLEHFGYADGISQPVVLSTDLPPGGKFWDDDTDPHEVAFVKDGGTSMPDAYGSYFVFRKLEQNVKGFKEAEEALGLGEIGGAYVVGRFEDGTPVAVFGEEQHPNSEKEFVNDFDYKNDGAAAKCPYHAHIRVTNPRDIQPAKNPLRIVRRGIPYDEVGRNGNLSWYPHGGVGLLFMCYQKSIVRQFEVLQIQWANNGDITLPDKTDSGRLVAIDGVIGQGSNNKVPQQYPQSWGGAANCTGSSLSHFVTMKGGEYFFAPSIPFLQSLNVQPAINNTTALTTASKSTRKSYSRQKLKKSTK